MVDKKVKPEVHVGAHTYGMDHATIHYWGEGANLFVGKYCSIGRGLSVFLGGNHRVDWNTTYPFPKFQDVWKRGKRVSEPHTLSKGDVSIGNDVWIGEGTTILSGVSIGDGAVIGTKSVVSTSIDPYKMAAGNPARVFAPRPVDAPLLLFLKWWDWPDEVVAKAVPLLCSPDTEPLIGFFCRVQDLSREEFDYRYNLWYEGLA